MTFFSIAEEWIQGLVMLNDLPAELHPQPMNIKFKTLKIFNK